MCTVCGCSGSDENVLDDDSGTEHHKHDHHHHAHDHHHHDHDHHHYGTGAAGVSVAGMSQGRLVKIEQDILAKNDSYATANRLYFGQLGLLALNLVSSPGSGKTTLLVRTIKMLSDEHACSVIEGDQQTSADADRIRATGVPALQINTGKGCHLDAHMVGHAVEHLKPEPGSFLFIENVGNLVCPAAFDLGEAHKVAILSVTEGEDKPLKYPDMFAASDLVLLNKSDLLPHLDFDVDLAIANARKVNPAIRHIVVSAKTGEGMEMWLAWLNGALAMNQATSQSEKTAAGEV